MAVTEIRAVVQSRGDSFDQLYPYRCPDGDHWHLSHFRQGHVRCPVCSRLAEAFDVGEVWIVAKHRDDTGQPCSGERAKVVSAA